MRLHKWSGATVKVALTLVAAACGGSGVDDGATPSTPTGTISGPVQVLLTREVDTLSVDQSLQLTAVVPPTPGNPTTVAPAWTSSNPSIAAVTQSGVVFAVSSGRAVITVTSRGSSDATTVTVKPSLRIVEFVADTLAIGLKQNVSLPFRAIDSDGKPVDLSKHKVEWMSTAPEVAPVTGDATVQGKTIGGANVHLVVDGKASTMRVNVKPQAVSSITVTPTPLTVAIAQQTQLQAVVADAAGNTLARGVNWKTSDASIAVVNSTGYVTPVSAGKVSITAQSESKKGVAVVTVAPLGSEITPTAPVADRPPVASITVQLNATTLTVGQSAQATAVLKDASSNVLTERYVAWASSDENVATVDDNGLVSANDNGSAVITASSEGKSENVVLVVNSPTLAPHSISVATNATTLTVGELTQATAVVKDVNGKIIPNAVVSWSSSPTNVASISVNGMVLAKEGGTAAITASISGITRSASVTVVAPTAPTSPTDPAPTSPTATGPWTGTAKLAELPRSNVSTAYPSMSRQVRVPAGTSLQAAINAAQPGDELLLAPGATYTSEFVLPNKGANTAWIVIRTEVSDAALGAPGTRMTPSRARSLNLAKIVTNTNQAAVSSALGANHYRLTGVEITATGTQDVYSLVDFGEGDASQTLSTMAHDLILDRSYVHGLGHLNLRRCVSLNSATAAVVDSWLGECHSNQGDSQAISGINGPGPFLIQNSMLEGGHMAFMFGGGDPTIAGLVPSDITIRGNHMYRPAAWKGVWGTKTIAETKNARRVLIEGNMIENVWADGQVGFALLFKSTNQDGGCTWCTTSDVTFRYNRVRNVAALFNIAAMPDRPAVPAARFTIHDNVMDNVNVGQYNGPGIALQVLGDVADVIFAHNTTIAPNGNSITMFDGSPNSRLVMHSNVFTNGQYGVFGSGAGIGTQALNAYAPGFLFAANAIIGANCGVYPVGTTCPSSISGIGFVNPTGGDYRLSSTSSYTAKGYDGRSVGADADKVNVATMGAVVAP